MRHSTHLVFFISQAFGFIICVTGLASYNHPQLQLVLFGVLSGMFLVLLFTAIFEESDS